VVVRAAGRRGAGAPPAEARLLVVVRTAGRRGPLVRAAGPAGAGAPGPSASDPKRPRGQGTPVIVDRRPSSSRRRHGGGTRALASRGDRSARARGSRARGFGSRSGNEASAFRRLESPTSPSHRKAQALLGVAERGRSRVNVPMGMLGAFRALRAFVPGWPSHRWLRRAAGDVRGGGLARADRSARANGGSPGWRTGSAPDSARRIAVRFLRQGRALPRFRVVMTGNPLRPDSGRARARAPSRASSWTRLFRSCTSPAALWAPTGSIESSAMALAALLVHVQMESTSVATNPAPAGPAVLEERRAALPAESARRYTVVPTWRRSWPRSTPPRPGGRPRRSRHRERVLQLGSPAVRSAPRHQWRRANGERRLVERRRRRPWSCLSRCSPPSGSSASTGARRRSRRG